MGRIKHYFSFCILAVLLWGCKSKQDFTNGLPIEFYKAKMFKASNYTHEHEYQKSIATYNELLEYDAKLNYDQKHDIYFYIGNIHRNLHEYNKAIKAYNEALKYRRTSNPSLTNLAKCLVLTGDYQKFNKALDILLNQNPSHPYALLHKAYFLHHIKKDQKKTLAILDQFPSNAKKLRTGPYYYLSGRIALAQNNPEQAIDLLSTNIKLKRRLVDSYMDRAKAYYMLGDSISIQKAQHDIAIAIEKSKQKKQLLKTEGSLALLHDDISGACRKFKKSDHLRKHQSYPAYHLIDLINSNCK